MSVFRLGLTKKIQEKIHEKVAERKENQKQEKIETAKLRQEEIKARQAERLHQAQERGKRSARQEYGGQSERSSPRHKSVKGAVKYAGRTPRIEPAGDMLSGFLGPSFFGPTKKPKVPTKTTTVKTGNKTIRITEKAEGEEQPKKKKDADLGYLDPFRF